jgi:hypothetical protein
MNVTLVYGSNNKTIEIRDDDLIGVDVWDSEKSIRAATSIGSMDVAPSKQFRIGYIKEFK